MHICKTTTELTLSSGKPATRAAISRGLPALLQRNRTQLHHLHPHQEAPRPNQPAQTGSLGAGKTADSTGVRPGKGLQDRVSAKSRGHAAGVLQ